MTSVTGRRYVRRVDLNLQPDEKYCPGCEQIKKKSEFYANSSQPDGLQKYCKGCHNTINVESRRQSRAYYRLRRVRTA